MSTSYKTEDPEWQELHTSLQDLLAGYADNELEDDEVLIVEAHLAGCKLCRDDLARQVALNQHLSAMPLARMTVSLHEKLDRITGQPRSTDTQKQKPGITISPGRWLERQWLKLTFSAGGWATALALMVALYMQQMPSAPIAKFLWWRMLSPITRQLSKPLCRYRYTGQKPLPPGREAPCCPVGKRP